MRVTENNQNNINFTSRNKIIFEAEKVARLTRNNLYAVSVNKIVAKHPELLKQKNVYLKFLIRKNNTLKFMRNIYNKYNNSPSEYLQKLVCQVLTYKSAQCKELESIDEMIMRINNIKNCGQVKLFNQNNKSLNHTVSFIQTKKGKAIYIDSFFGKADYLKNLELFYKNYHNYFFKMKSSDKLVPIKKAPLYLDEKQISILRKKYPQFIFNSDYLKNI